MILMNGDREVVRISDSGECDFIQKEWMPYDLYLEDSSDDITIRVQNLNNFYHWCATRILSLDRKYLKEILNCIGATQRTTDKDRAEIAMSYHCLSLMDNYWTKDDDEAVDFKDINLFDNSLSNAFIDLSLRGKSLSVENRHMIADDLGTSGMFPKAWLRTAEGFKLLKDGDEDAVEKELLASKIAGCFDVSKVNYESSNYDDVLVSSSKIFTSKNISIVSMEAFQIYALNNELNWLDEVLKIDAYSYYMMNLVDYLIGNTDRHWGNWGFLRDNDTGELIKLHPLMDFNRSFESYDNVDGSICQTTAEYPTYTISQREAAQRAVEKVGLNQISDIDETWFKNKNWLDTFKRRLEILKNQSLLP